MKKCPTCEKTFDDNMKFCQSDGTPLVEAQETPVETEDPYKTTVAKAEDLPIPPESTPPAADPFQTMVAGSLDEVEEKQAAEADKKEDFDPMQTIVSTDMPESKSFEPEPVKEEPVLEVETEDASPPSPFSKTESEPEVLNRERRKEDQITPAPEPPKFSEPDLSPPSLSDASGQLPELPKEQVAETQTYSTEEDKPDVNEYESVEAKDEEASIDSVAPPTSENVAPPTSDGSEFKQQNNPPIPSPFDSSMPPSYQKPSAPMPPYLEEEVKSEALNTPFAEEVQENQQIEQSGWSPPSPFSESQSQGTGQQNAPFQSAVDGVEGEDKKLAIASLVLGILSTLCGFAFVAGIPAIIAGYISRKKINESPSEYGGGTLAMIGMILGAIGTLVVTAAYVIVILMSFT